MSVSPLLARRGAGTLHILGLSEVLGLTVKDQVNRYLNRRVEQDHRGIKQRYYPMLGLGSLPCACSFCRAFDHPHH